MGGNRDEVLVKNRFLGFEIYGGLADHASLLGPLPTSIEIFKINTRSSLGGLI